MALTIHVIPTGESIQTNGQPLPSLEALHEWAAAETGVKATEQIVLTSKGKHVQQQSLLTENVLYLYNLELFTSSTGSKNITPDPLPQPWTPVPFPTDLRDQSSLKSWQSLFKQRKQWASDILEDCRAMCAEAEAYLAMKKTIENGIRVATSKHDSYLQKLGQQCLEVKSWYSEINRRATSKIQLWENDLNKLSAIPVDSAFGGFFGKDSTPRRKSTDGPNANLAYFIDESAIKQASTQAKAALEACGGKLDELGAGLEKITTEYNDLILDLGNSQTRSLRDDPEEPRRQLHEVRAIATKIASDCEHVCSLANDTKSMPSASKMALLHTKNFLPNLRDCAAEMYELLRYNVEQKNTMTQRALKHLETIARIEAAIPGLRKAFESLEISEVGLTALDTVASASQLPIVYGSLLIEAARRKEWVDKMKHDSASLAEEIAGYQEEEQRRRRKWMKSATSFVSDAALEGKMLSVEVNLQGEDHQWPSVSRQDIENYIASLQGVPGLDAVVESLTQTLRTMDQPTRQQVRRAKTFKGGSVHEAGFGRGSLMLRGDDESKVLREANLKLEDEAKGYKSRIRKLEDLLHRQSMFNRLSTGVGSQSSPFGERSIAPMETDRPSHLPMSPKQGDISRRSSTSSRRVSFNNQGQDERLLARKIVQLEADLMAAKTARDRQDRNHQNAIEEANSTKKDLLENMEAQQREFAVERRALEEELSKMKLRLEEVDDEFDRFAGSRENEKTNADARLQTLLVERDEARKEASDQIQQASDKVQQAEERTKTLERNLQERDERDVERLDMLKGVYGVLDAETDAPVEPAALISALEELVRKSQDQARELAQAVALAKSENEHLQTTLETQKIETARLEGDLENKDTETNKVREQLQTEQDKAASITAELENEREHLRELREKFADGETGSESLRQRLEEEQERVSSMASQLAEARSHVNSLNEELLSLHTKYRNLQDLLDASNKRLQERSQRAKAVSQRLYAYNDRLIRLLQTLGFVISLENSNMKIERASRVSGASTTLLSDASTILLRTSGSTNTRWSDDLADMSLLLWSEKDSPVDEETKYTEFMERIGRFNLDIFSDTIGKRMRDIEHTARKYQREARSHRERLHKFQIEAHDKIAFRGFKEGDLALFLPTRNQALRPWAAFNVGAPHYFLREREGHRLKGRDWLVARISKVEERVVDLSKTISYAHADDGQSIGGTSFEDDNPFDLSDGLRWYLLEAQEEKMGAPSTPGLGKAVVSTSTVSATRDDARATGVRIKKKPTDAVEEASRALSRSLDSRRSSHSSKRSFPVPAPAGLGIKTSASNEAFPPDSTGLHPNVNGNSNGNAGPGPSHLRTTSDAASLGAGNEGIDEAPTSPVSPSAKSPSKSWLRRNTLLSSTAPAAASASPAASPSATPQKQKLSSAKAGAWDSLFQYEISLQGGKRRA